MKSVVYLTGLLCFLLIGRAASAQALTNAGFETWGTRGIAEAPANWLTLDDVLLFENPGNTFNTGTVTKSADAHSGSFAAKLTNISFNDGQGGTFVQEGALLLGTKIRGRAYYEGYPIGGVPYAARPTQLQFFYKLTGPVADSAVATLLLTKTSTTGGLPTILGGGTLLLAPTAGSYVGVAVTIPYSTAYPATTLPDSVRIQFLSGTATKLAAGSVLLVDDVALAGGALAVRADAATQALLTVSPNPSLAGRFQVNAPAQPALASAPYTVLDLTGRVVAQQPALAVPSPTRELDLSNLSTGIYLLRLDSKQGTIVRQLVVK